MRALFLLTSILLGVSVTQQAEQTTVQQFAEGNVKFTAQVYREILKVLDDNFIISPLSVDMVLALTQAGAKGETAEELTQGIHLPAEEVTDEAVRSFSSLLKTSTDKLKLSLANTMFAGKEFNISQSYKAVASEVFDADVQNVDFSQKEEAAATINNWVAEKTENLIKDLISPDALDENTRLVLVNALYFMGEWSVPFDESITSKETFYTNAKSSVVVEMMHEEGTFGYLEEGGVTFLELPYKEDTISMTIILPNEVEGLSAIEEDIENLLSIRDLPRQGVDVSLPKWTSETQTDFTEVLSDLGVKKLFTNEADLSGISDEALYVSKIVQKAFINVTECGTQASGATAVVAPGAVNPSVPAEFIPFKADHPFMYVIREKENGIVLFAGRYTH